MRIPPFFAAALLRVSLMASRSLQFLAMPRVPLLALLLAAAGCAHGPSRGLLAPDDVPEGWVVHETEHFQVQTDAGADHATSLGSRLERILVLYRQTLPCDRPMPRF